MALLTFVLNMRETDMTIPAIPVPRRERVASWFSPLQKAGWMGRFFCWGILLLLGGLEQAFTFRASAQAAITPEYRIKAVFLFNFAQFVEWPAGAFASPQDTLVIGVLGTDPFGKFLDETVRGEVVQGRRIEVRRYRSVEEIKACHILFISASEMDQYDKILKGLEARPILSVGDFEGFANRGGMVRFTMEKNKIRLRINLAAVRASKLTISSKLLRVAEIVGNEKE